MKSILNMTTNPNEAPDRAQNAYLGMPESYYLGFNGVSIEDATLLTMYNSAAPANMPQPERVHRIHQAKEYFWFWFDIVGDYTLEHNEDTWGGEVTATEADRAAELLLQMLRALYPMVRFDGEYSGCPTKAGVRQSDSDEDSDDMCAGLTSSINHWVSQNFSKALESPQMVWDLRAIYEGPGGFWAEYGDGSLVNIGADESPDSVSDSSKTRLGADKFHGYQTERSCPIIKAANIVFKHDAELEGWGVNDGQATLAAVNYMSTHMSQNLLLQAWLLSERSAVPETLVNPETNTEDKSAGLIIYSEHLGCAIHVLTFPSRNKPFNGILVPKIAYDDLTSYQIPF